jgi:carbon-monoxide dehydrogenase medium subunit
VKPPRLQYLRPGTLQEAIEAKAGYDGDASILAGGQSLVPMLNFRLARPSALIDLGGVPGLDTIAVEGGQVRAGAMVRQRDLERHAGAIAACRSIADGLDHVAHPVIRNRGTIGGTIAHADAAAEMPTVLTAVDGSVVVRGTGGERTIPAAELFEFHLTTSLEFDEVLAEVRFPVLPATTGTAFVEVARRHGDYALAGVCAVVDVDGGVIRSARLACSGIAPTPIRATDAESLLAGQQPTPEVLAAAGEAAAGYVDAVDEEQASVAYRQQLVRTLIARAVTRACEQTATPQEA